MSAGTAFAEESIRLKTAYPAPYAEHEELLTTGFTRLATDDSPTSKVIVGTAPASASLGSHKLEVWGGAKLALPLQIKGESETQAGMVFTADKDGVGSWKTAAGVGTNANEIKIYQALGSVNPKPGPKDQWHKVKNAELKKHAGRIAVVRAHTNEAHVWARPVGSAAPGGKLLEDKHFGTLASSSGANQHDWPVFLVLLDENGEFELFYHLTDPGSFRITLWLVGVI